MKYTNEYIDMCDKAHEIQEVRTELEYLEDGDCYVERQFPYAMNCNGFSHNSTNQVWFDPMKMIWIPRQDQLQELCNDSYDIVRFSHLIIESDRMNTNIISQFDTLEKQWLAFLMDKLYNKHWNKEEQKWK